MRYDRGRGSIDRHATDIVSSFVAGASRWPSRAGRGRRMIARDRDTQRIHRALSAAGYGRRPMDVT